MKNGVSGAGASTGTGIRKIIKCVTWRGRRCVSERKTF